MRHSRRRWCIEARNWILCLTIGCATLGVGKASGPLYRLTLIGGSEVTATAINNAGAVTGSIVTATGTHAFLWNGGVMTDLGSIAGYDAVGLAINDAGQIVGNLTPQQGHGQSAVPVQQWRNDHASNARCRNVLVLLRDG